MPRRVRLRPHPDRAVTAEDIHADDVPAPEPRGEVLVGNIRSA
jgi:hypothetical protein